MTEKLHLRHIACAMLMIFAVVCLIVVTRGNHQASWPVPMPQEFEGEYSYNGEHWTPLTADAELSALNGTLYLRGHFLREMQEGWQLNYYRNHIGVLLKVNGERIHIDTMLAMPDIQAELFESMCAREWMKIIVPHITPDDLIEIELHNPHRLGNQSAYKDFLTTLCSDSVQFSLLQLNLETYGKPFRIASGLAIITALLLLSGAIAVAIVHIPVWETLLALSLMTLFTGGFILFDTIDVSYWSDLNVLNTYASQLCMILAVFFLEYLIGKTLTGTRQKIARGAVLLSAVFDMVLIYLSFAGTMVIFDTLPYWVCSQWILLPLLLVCCGLELRHTPKGARILPISQIVMGVAILLDTTGAGGSIVWRSPWSKIAFGALFILLIGIAAKAVIKNHGEAIRAAKLEKELEESRIAIMLSQIQPHFIYNTLGTIEQLCLDKPEHASQLTHNFSLYLRGNFSQLGSILPIRFTQEIEHVKHYTEIEQYRFPDITICYELTPHEFFLPALTVQPLVENAIKHGLMGLEEGGTVRIISSETDTHYCVQVIDDGVGFDVDSVEGGTNHIGIRNVRERLAAICGGSLTIESEPGKGTCATIMLPKEA